MKRIAAMILCGLAATAHAQVKIENAWVRSTVPQQKVSGGFLQLTSVKDARLVAVKSSVSGVVEIHEMKMEGDMMRMRPVQSLTLPAGKKVELKPGGYHLMLMELKQQLSQGQRVPLEFQIEEGGKRYTVKADASVR
jgi:periplasmic copper chaperone A